MNCPDCGIEFELRITYKTLVLEQSTRTNGYKEMSRLSYSQLEYELNQGRSDDQLKRIQSKYGIAAKRQLMNRVSFTLKTLFQPINIFTPGCKT